MAWDRSVQRVLLAAVSSTSSRDGARPPARRSDGVPIAELVAAAHFHGIGGYVRNALQAMPGDAGSREVEALGQVVFRTLALHLRTLADLGRLASVLDASGIPWLVVKGPVLAETVHASPELRGYSDLDVLVSPGCFGRAVELLEADGCRLVDRNWLLLHRELKGELRMELPHGTPLDLHWHLLNHPSVRERFRLHSDWLLARRRNVTVGSLQVPTLDAAGTVVYVAMHAVLSGLYRLIWLKDVELASTAGGLDWGEVVETARAWRAELPLAVALDRVRGTLGAASPGSGADLEASFLWRKVCSTAGALSPVQAADGSGSTLRLATRATRDGLASSVAESLRRVAGLGRTLATRRSVPRGPDGRISHDHPGSGAFAAGGTEARAAFVEAVARLGR